MTDLRTNPRHGAHQSESGAISAVLSANLRHNADGAGVLS